MVAPPLLLADPASAPRVCAAQRRGKPQRSERSVVRKVTSAWTRDGHLYRFQVSSSLAANTAVLLECVAGLPAHRLELEITQAVLIRDDEAALVMLHQLRSLGVLGATAKLPVMA